MLLKRSAATVVATAPADAETTAAVKDDLARTVHDIDIPQNNREVNEFRDILTETGTLDFHVVVLQFPKGAEPARPQYKTPPPITNRS